MSTLSLDPHSIPGEMGGRGLLFPFYRKEDGVFPLDSPVSSGNNYKSQPHAGLGFLSLSLSLFFFFGFIFSRISMASKWQAYCTYG